MGSFIRSLFSKTNTLYEFEGQLFSDNDEQENLVPIDSLDDVDGAKKILTDFDNQAFARLMYVESQPKYAELLAKKKIVDTGEFEDIVDLHVHSKQKFGAITKLYCTPMSTHVIEHYKNITSNNSDSTLFFSIHDALWDNAKKRKSKTPSIIIFTHHKSFDLLIASSKQVYFAGRFNAFEYDEESIEAIWDIISVEVKKIQEELSSSFNQAYLYHSGVDSNILKIISDSFSKLSIDLNVPTSVKRPRAHNLHMLSEPVNLSQLMGSPIDKLFYFFQNNMTKISMASIVASCLLMSVAAAASWKTQQLNKELATKKQEISLVKIPVVTIPEDLSKNVNFYQSLHAIANKKQIANVFADLSNSASDNVTIKKLNLSRKQSITNIEVDGFILSNFDDAYQSYKKIVLSMNNKNYRVLNEAFSTDINQSNFSFTLEYK